MLRLSRTQYFIILVISSLFLMNFVIKYHYGKNPQTDPNSNNQNVNYKKYTTGKWAKEFSFDNVCGEHIRKLLKIHPRLVPKYVVRSDWNYAISTHNPRTDYVSQMIIDRGGLFDWHLVNWLIKLHREGFNVQEKIPGEDNYRIKNRKDWIMLDIGANIGTESFFAANLGHFVIAFEPLEINYLKMCETVYLNDWQDRFYIIPRAFSNVKGKLKTCFNTENTGGSSVNSTCGETNVWGDVALEMQVEVLDEFFEEYELPIDKENFVVHIDTEGSEYKIIKTSPKFLNSPNLQFICAELFNQEDAIEIFKIFRKLKNWYVGRIYEYDYLDFDTLINDYVTSDYVFLRNPWKMSFDLAT
eukprot:TRINITY_DN2263_c0_g1_i1.p1 TRINITY_DN2263_c0_g1~~TRINITY_DN2263_c0_g1_i1.p1  ORF type:complete len:357 (-),score=6.47 TRINITY_DN2263_c0_g1_i1:209-1279(-)